MMKRILVAGLSPTLQKTITFRDIQLDRVNRSLEYRLDASGKAVNTARVLGQLGGYAVSCLCPLGTGNAAVFESLAAEDGLDLLSVPVGGNVRYCYTLLEKASPRVTELVVGEPSEGDDYAAVAQALLDRLAASLSGLGSSAGVRDSAHASGPDVGALVREPLLAAAGLPSASDGPIAAAVIAGSRPAFFPDSLYPDMARAIKRSGSPLLVDFHGADLRATLGAARVDIVKINDEEFCGTFGLDWPIADEALLDALAAVSRDTGALFVITRGDRDILAADGSRTWRQPVTPVAAVNTIGCGDTFSAGFLHEWLASGDVPRALARAAECAARNALSVRPGDIRLSGGGL